ncbi:MAG: MATE family efflux transporter [Termitinemataceae bacterium]|nr:MAG: MATE family efflux transporter [Termitinemataceae bacterium]
MKKDSTWFFEEAPASRAIAHFAIPMMIGMLVFIVYNLVDMLFIGMLDDPNLIAAVTLAMPLFTLTMGLSGIFGIGAGTYISRLLGEKNYLMAKNVSAFVCYSVIGIGIIVTALGFIFLKPILAVLGTQAGTFNPTRDYAIIFIAGFIPIMLSFALGQIVRAEGAAKVSMMGNVIGTVSNIILDPIFIFLFGWGLKGAAFATVLSYLLAALFYVFYLTQKSKFLSLKLSDFKINKEIAKPIFSIGLPAFLQDAVVIAVSLVQNNLAAAYGDIFIAVIGVILKVGMLPRALARGLCMGVQPLLGYNFASLNIERLKKIMKLTALYSTVLGAVIFLGLFIAGANVLKAFIKDADIIALGTPFLRISLVSFLTYGITFLFTSLFQATGIAKPAFAMSLTLLYIFLPVLLFANYTIGIRGYAWALPLTDILTMILGVILYQINRKKIMAHNVLCKV